MGTGLAQMVLARTIPSGLLADLALIFTLYLAWNSNSVRGAGAGMLFGLAQDAVLGISLGINGISKTLIGFAAAAARKWAAPEGGLARALFLAALAALDNFLVYGLLALLNQQLRRGFWADFAAEVALTAVVGALIFQLYDRVKFPRKDFRRLS
ncbi:MAG: rod shape-determining protein MreD [Acidobacteriota bacterium]